MLFGHLGKEPLLPSSHVKPESTCITYFSSFFGQTEHLNSFQIDAREKTLHQNRSYKMKSFRRPFLKEYFKIHFHAALYAKSSMLVILYTEVLFKAPCLIPVMFMLYPQDPQITFCNFGDFILGPHSTSFAHFDPGPPEFIT